MSAPRIPGPGEGALARGDAAGEATAQRLDRARASGDPEKLRRAAQAFEAWFLEQMMKEMRGSSIEDPSSTLSTFQGMLDEELTRRAAGAHGVGLADRIVASMTRRQAATAYADAAAVTKSPAAPGIAAVRDGVRWPLEHLPAGLRAPNHFGVRADPFTGERRLHKGLDLGAPAGAPIHPVAAGTVVEAGHRGGFGNLVVVDHGGGVRSFYAHAREVRVRPGDRVGPEDVVATVGSTGRSTAPHLHLEIRVDGEAVDPLEWLGASPGAALP